MIVCSKAFYGKIEPVKKELESYGHTIILPNSYDQPQQEYEIMQKSAEEHAKWKGEMFKASEQKIKESDAVLVLNYEKNNIKNYLGGSTLLEMYDAFKHNKKIFMINPIPEIMLQDEIKGFQPIILNGDLGKIKNE